MGILNGMPQALKYVRTGNQEIKPGEYLLVYTDGLEEVIFRNHKDIQGRVVDFLRKKDFKNLEKFCRRKVYSEGTLVYCTKN